jgi:DNA-binding CsgD family transcriptional regulator
MIFTRYSAVLILMHFLTFSSLTLDGQIKVDYLLREKEADSLAAIEKHKEAVEILRSIIAEQDSPQGDPGRLRLEYKTGYSLMQSGQNFEASSYFRKVIGKGSEDSYSGLINDAMTGLGITYEYTGKHDSAFYWYLEAYRQVRESNDTLRRARGARNMAQLLRVLKRFDEARFYCAKAVDLTPGIKDYKVAANIYNENAYLFELSDNLDSAVYYYNRLIDISIANGYMKGESVGYSNLAYVFEKQNKLKEALEFRLKGIEIDKEINDNYGLMTSFRGLSSTYLTAGDYDKALEAINKAHGLSDTSWLPDMGGIMMGYYEIYKAKAQFREALEYYEAYNRLHDRINQAESRKQVTELLARYETELKEQQIKILEQANLLKGNRIHVQWLIIGVMILLGLFIISTSWLWIRNKNHKLNQINAELQNFIIRQEQLNGREEQDNTNAEPAEMYKKWGLTDRESEILYYLGIGCSNTDIGEKLFISENTVKFHIKNIYLKLDVKNRIQALLRCKNDQPLSS